MMHFWTEEVIRNNRRLLKVYFSRQFIKKLNDSESFFFSFFNAFEQFKIIEEDGRRLFRTTDSDSYTATIDLGEYGGPNE